MLKILIIALLSMFRLPERHPKRTWVEELLVRNFRLRFEAILDAVHTTRKFDMGDILAVHKSYNGLGSSVADWEVSLLI